MEIVKEMKVVNLTPHELNIYNEDGDPVLTIVPSGMVARCSVERELIGRVQGVPLYRSVFGAVEGLPDEDDNPYIMYITSGMVRSAVPERLDVFQPGQLVRDDAGRVTGCVGLSQ